MSNIAKYWLLLETLQFKDPSGTEKTPTSQQKFTGTVDDFDQRLSHNTNTLKNFIKIDVHKILAEILSKLELTDFNVPECDSLKLQENPVAFYVLGMQYVLLEIVQNANFNSDDKKDLVSVNRTNLFIAATQDLSIYALRKNLHKIFYKSVIFADFKTDENNNFGLLEVSIELFAKILQIKLLHVSKSMELVLRDYMTAIFSLLLANHFKEYSLTDEKIMQLNMQLDNIWHNMTKHEFFRNILLLMQLPASQLQVFLHHHLIQKLCKKDGFTALVATLRNSQKSIPNQNDQSTFEVISGIVAYPKHTQGFYFNIIKQIFKFLKLCIMNEEAMSDNMGAGLLSLRNIYDLNKKNQQLICDTIYAELNKLCQPEDVITGLVLMENTEFHFLIALHYYLFCTSSIECLPTKILKRYLPMLFQIYYNIPPCFKDKARVAAILIRCLNNQPTGELTQLIEKLYKEEFNADWLQLHQRVVIYPNAEQTELTLKITSADYKPESNFSLSLTELLMSEQFNLLTYEIFMILLRLISKFVDEMGTKKTEIDLIQTEDELATLLSSKYGVAVEIIYSLNTLISHQPLRTQISENATEFLKFLRELIEKHIESEIKNVYISEQVLLIMLTLAQEILENTGMTEMYRDFIVVLKKLQKQKTNQLIQKRVEWLITLLNGDFKTNAAFKSNALNTARSLIESKEPHLQVYGIQMLLDMIRQKNTAILTNVHIIVALALTTLKDKDSYTFLNCVRLFGGLVHLAEAEIFELLIAEYLNEAAEIDYRLVVGECILKVSQELGPLCYKYKNMLLNCFMHGARSQLDEFRASAYSNLAQLCRTLAYQVNKFFQELLDLIACELTTCKYLPAKRAAVYVLSELLDGMDNIKDFETMLLPIHRLLKTIEGSENEDAKMREHAANGLKTLNKKCLEFLCVENKMEKEIKIFGVNAQRKTGGKKHILELN